MQDADAAPTPQTANVVPVLSQSTQNLLKQWEELQKTELPQLKSQLRIKDLPQIKEPLELLQGITSNRDEE